MKLSNDELTFLYQLLDQITVRGLPQKQMVLVIMAKLTEQLREEEITDEDDGEKAPGAP